jgi:hypothetical protein
MLVSFIDVSQDENYVPPVGLSTSTEGHIAILEKREV